MFNLDKEINAWCRSVHPFGLRHKARISELKDHLYSAVEQHQKEGMSEKEAFFHAIGRMGEASDLAEEHSKNSSIFSTIINRMIQFECRLLNRWSAVLENSKIPFVSNALSSKWKIGLLNIVVSLFFAGAILISSFFIKDPDMSSSIMYFWIAIWFIPYMFLSTVGMRVSKTDKTVKTEG
ncbi:MAG: hypothetical protein ACI9EW_002180 [Cellvibrionaceae bacterium]|jgi:hypothetical protein